MAEQETAPPPSQEQPQSPPLPPPPSSQEQPQPSPPASSQPHSDPPPPPPPPVPEFDPSRMIGIIRRKALIKDLAAAYHAECLDYCQELLELQRRWEETYKKFKTFEDSRKDIVRPSKRVKKVR